MEASLDLREVRDRDGRVICRLVGAVPDALGAADPALTAGWNGTIALRLSSATARTGHMFRRLRSRLLRLVAHSPTTQFRYFRSKW